MKINFKFSLLLLIVLSLGIFAGCSEKVDCSTKDTSYVKYSLNEETGECIVAKEIKKDICGNGVAEDGETYCNCPKDIKKTDVQFGCSGDLGEYLSKSCDEFSQECILKTNEKVIEEVKSLELKNSDVIFNLRVTYSNPFVLNVYDSSKLKFDLSLFKFPSTSKEIRNILVKEVLIETSTGKLLATINYNENVASLGSNLKVKEVKLSDTSKYESSESIRIKMIASYSVDILDTKGNIVRTEEKVETLTSSLGKLNLINPNFYN